MSGGTLCKVSVGRNGGASNNALYITRANAIADGMNGVLIRHMDEVTDSSDFAVLRTDVSSYFWAREEVELGREGKNTSAGRSNKVQSGKRAGKIRQTRTHYRVILSFEREVETEKAKEIVSEWLDKTPFKDAPAIAAIHRDTAHPHVHILIDARQVSGKKVSLSPREFHTLDEVWNEIYCREFGLDERKHLAKKTEMREYKRAVLKAKREGEPLPERPSRSNFPERDKFTRREAREDKSIARDETWNAAQRFDRSVRKIERQIRSQLDLRYQLNKQLNPLAQLESRVQVLCRLGEKIYDAGKGLHDAYQRRVAVRESIFQGGSGDIAEASTRGRAGTREGSSRVRTAEGRDQRGSNREGKGKSTGRAITGEAKPITTDGRSGASEQAGDMARVGERTRQNSTRTGQISVRTGQERGEGCSNLASGESDNTKFRNKSTKPSQDLTITEDSYAASHLSLSGTPHATGSERARVDYSEEECGGRAGVSLEQDGDSLGTAGANRAGDSVTKQENLSLSEAITRNSLGDLRAGDGIELSTWSDEISDPSLNDRGFDFLWSEPQGIPFAGVLSEGVGREVERNMDYTDMGLGEGACGRGDSVIADVGESGVSGIWGESGREGQSSSNVYPVGADASLRVERGVDEKYLQSNLLDSNLKERLIASNDTLLESVKQSEFATTLAPAEQIIELEAENPEVADSVSIIDFFL